MRKFMVKAAQVKVGAEGLPVDTEELKSKVNWPTRAKIDNYIKSTIDIVSKDLKPFEKWILKNVINLLTNDPQSVVNQLINQKWIVKKETAKSTFLKKEYKDKIVHIQVLPIVPVHGRALTTKEYNDEIEKFRSTPRYKMKTLITEEGLSYIAVSINLVEIKEELL